MCTWRETPAKFSRSHFSVVAIRTIVIIKDTVPDNAQDFSVTTTASLTPPFNLDDDADGTLANTQMFPSVPAGT